MYGDLLPIGSIVLLRGAKRKLMITGRILSDEKLEQIYDYVGCLYPEGNTGEENQYFFNRDAIERVCFIGCQDEEELKFKSEILSQLGELMIKDGQIVPKE
ncbi:MAG: DUF4176 domain-containing protein [Lachnospiraceae bacterium]|nr:DUF4176 domain-containing protein [Lachnospiraceae bacterium]